MCSSLLPNVSLQASTQIIQLNINFFINVLSLKGLVKEIENAINLHSRNEV